MTERKIEILKTTAEPALITDLMHKTHLQHSILKLVVEKFVQSGLMTATPVTNASRLVLLKTTEKGIKAVKDYERAVGALP